MVYNAYTLANLAHHNFQNPVGAHCLNNFYNVLSKSSYTWFDTIFYFCILKMGWVKKKSNNDARSFKRF